MRRLTILTLVVLGIASVSVAQEQRPPWERDPGQSDARPANRFPGGTPPWSNGPPPSMQRGQRPPERSNNNRGRNADQTNRMVGMFRSMDANRNGILEPNEVSENRRAFVSAAAARMGADPNRPINLADLERRAASGNTSSRNSGSNRDNNRNNNSNRNNSGQNRNNTVFTEPLVPAFGEPQPQAAPILGFGQREAVQTPIAVSLPMAAPASAAQPNSPAPAARQSAPYAHLPEDVRENASLDWFFSYDNDKDGQLTMQEYVGGYGGIWTPAIAAEFRFLDRNGDGFATIDEVLLTLKEVDEQRAAEEAAKTQEAEQNKPAVTPPGGLHPPSSGPFPGGPDGQAPAGMAVPDENAESNGKNNSTQNRRSRSRNR